jgi:threonylcarbamoyladenosine tRNA methylthiotransferase MtaB
VSLGPAEAVRRSVELEGLGYREVVITGVNIASYSSEGIDLPRLLHLLLGETGTIRFRLSSLEPEGITEALGKVITHHRICPHFHIPVQSGSDSVLGRMGRRSQTGRIREAVALLRASKMDPYLAADIIVGFPGETETEFARTRRLVEEASFAALHVFPYSPRPGTRAAVLKPMVPERTRHQRAKELRAVGRMSTWTYTHSWIGRDVEVLLEGGAGSRGWGVSENYLKVDVSAVPAAEESEGRIARARITSAHGTCAARFLCFE